MLRKGGSVQPARSAGSERAPRCDLRARKGFDSRKYANRWRFDLRRERFDRTGPINRRKRWKSSRQSRLKNYSTALKFDRVYCVFTLFDLSIPEDFERALQLRTTALQKAADHYYKYKRIICAFKTIIDCVCDGAMRSDRYSSDARPPATASQSIRSSPRCSNVKIRLPPPHSNPSESLEGRSIEPTKDMRWFRSRGLATSVWLEEECE